MLDSTEIEKCKQAAAADDSQDFKHHVSERVKFYEETIKGSPSPSHKKPQTNINNIHLAVPIGILIVLFTLYLATAAFHNNYIYYKDQKDHGKVDESISLNEKEKQQAQEAAQRIKILEKLLEYKDLCTELEVFTKDLRWLNELITKEDPSEKDDGSIGDEEEEKQGEQIDKNTQNVNPIKKLTYRNLQQRSNKATSLKNQKVKSESNKNLSDSSNKKDQTTAKKSNTAEPIIYLFALVFIYLLVKAASDINQHYKSQNKGDKRLRRCSLQSYAQTHKQDRRASKGSPKLKHDKELLMKTRSNSVDHSNEIIENKYKILANLRKYISLDERNRVANMPNGVHGSIQSPVMCKTINNEEIALNNKEGFVAKLGSRRCSVPVSLNFQRHKLNTGPLVSANNISARRTSLTGLEHGQEGPFYEVKRRVRMINRH